VSPLISLLYPLLGTPTYIVKITLFPLETNKIRMCRNLKDTDHILFRMLAAEVGALVGAVMLQAVSVLVDPGQRRRMPVWKPFL
jgi:hypothetical protein